MRWVFLIGGGLATAAMLVISMRLNYLFGYGLGQTADNALVFGVVSVVADAWKGLGPVFILVLARARRWPTAMTASVVWVACFFYSVSSALGIAIQDRSILTGGRETMQAAYAEVKAELVGLEAKLNALGQHRSTGEAEAAMKVVLMRPVMAGERIRGTVGTLSANCSRIDARTAEACAEVALLRQELAVAEEAVTLNARIAELRGRARQLRERGATLSSDPQAELFARLTGGWISVRDVGPGLALLLAVVIELVSAFGPAVLAAYADTTRVPKAAAEPSATPLVAAGRALSQHVAARRDEPDAVMEFMAERIAPAREANAICANEIFADYVAWCRGRKCTPLDASEFLAEFDRQRRECDLEAKIRKFGSRYFGIRLAGAPASS